MQADNQGNDYIKDLREDLEDPVILKASWEGRGVDDTLQNIVHLSNQAGMSLSLTLNIGGSLVTGVLISIDEYYQEIIRGVSASAEDPKNTAAIHLRDMLNRMRPEAGNPVAPQFIHLKNAKIFNGDQKPIPGNGTYWRGKISSVDGFFFGSLKHDS